MIARWLLKKLFFFSIITTVFSVFLFSPRAFGRDTLGTTLQGVDDFKGFVEVAVNIFNQFVVLFIGLAVLVIVWGIFKYIRKVDDPKERTNGMRFVAWGVLGVFIMVSFWGFVNILRNTFVLPGTVAPGANNSPNQNTLPDEHFDVPIKIPTDPEVISI